MLRLDSLLRTCDGLPLSTEKTQVLNEFFVAFVKLLSLGNMWKAFSVLLDKIWTFETVCRPHATFSEQFSSFEQPFSISSLLARFSISFSFSIWIWPRIPLQLASVFTNLSWCAKLMSYFWNGWAKVTRCYHFREGNAFQRLLFISETFELIQNSNSSLIWFAFII